MQKHSQWKRNCPCCGNVIEYSRKDSFTLANKENRKCYTCTCVGRSPWNKGLDYSDERVKKSVDGLIKYHTGRKQSSEQIQKRILKTTGLKRNSETKLKIGESNRGKIRSVATKKKLSEAAIKRIQKYKLYNKPNFNPKACDFINILNKVMGLNLQHALNGGEIWLHGFYPDGYDRNNNIIFEYDEPWHKSEKHKNYGKWRQDILIETTKPSLFLRYNPQENELVDVISNQKIQVEL